MNPDLYIITDATWESFDAHETNAAYERYGILPGAFYHEGEKYPNGVYMSERTWRHILSMFRSGTMRPWTVAGLGEHENIHAWTGFEHPTTIRLGIQHAMACGFDTRAYTRLLRWRWSKTQHANYLAWLGEKAKAWDDMLLLAKPAPSV